MNTTELRSVLASRIDQYEADMQAEEGKRRPDRQAVAAMSIRQGEAQAILDLLTD